MGPNSLMVVYLDPLGYLQLGEQNENRDSDLYRDVTLKPGWVIINVMTGGRRVVYTIKIQAT